MTAFGPALSIRPCSLSAKMLEVRESPNRLFVKFAKRFPNCFLLESAKGKSRLAEYSFIGFEPSKLVQVKNNIFEVTDEENGSKDGFRVSDPLTELRKLVPPNSAGGLFRFLGGAVGYISYDAVRHWEKLPSTARDDLGLPDSEFGVYTDGIVFDHIKREVFYYTLRESRLQLVERILRSEEDESGTHSSKATPTMHREQFEEIVQKARDYIYAGDVFQVVLSKRYDFESEGDLTRFYSTLSKINPSPYMYFVKFGDRKVVGSSPEMLMRVEDRKIETFPIAGTRPNVKDKGKNLKLTNELLSDPKENAEHLMLVDLARNDVGRVSEYGSVKVPEFLMVEQFSHVQHMVSHVTGELRSEFDAYDALRAMFPAGTVSGAPKVRAMEIIEELEPLRRGPYAGAVGYFSFNGNADFAITIRTLVANGKKCSIQSGAGIVADSSPESEWFETEAKSAGLLSALEKSEGL